MVYSFKVEFFYDNKLISFLKKICKGYCENTYNIFGIVKIVLVE